MSKIGSRSIQVWAERLDEAMMTKVVLEPLTSSLPAMDIEDAYQVSLALMERRVARGEQVIGKKIGVTSAAVQNMLGVFEPDFGFLTDAMLCDPILPIPISQHLIQPRAEGELAFMLKADLKGPGVCAQEVLAATEWVCPCVEIVDSRIRDWRITIVDTVADNASCGLFVLGEKKSDPKGIDLAGCGMVMTKNHRVTSTGAGAAVQGSPAAAVAWLANKLGSFGVPLAKGDLVLSGSWLPLEPVASGDVMTLTLGDNLGDMTLRFQ